MNRVIVTGTDTGVGKTVFASGLAGALDGFYWKPIQAGTEPEGDRETARRLSGLPPERILPEAYRLKLPASPHLSAREEGIEIVPERLAVPDAAGPLVIEGAGGVLVPVTEHGLQARLDELLAVELSDDVLSWTLGPDGRWTRAPEGGSTETITLLCRIDTLDEVDYFCHGGILHYVLRQLLAQAEPAGSAD